MWDAQGHKRRSNCLFSHPVASGSHRSVRMILSSLNPLPAGEQFEDPALIPDGNRPIRKPVPVRDVPLSQDRNAFGARKGRDGVTRWCYSCDTTLDRDSGLSFCNECRVIRNTMSAERRRRDGQPVVLQREDAAKIIADTDRVVEAITEAVLQFDRAYMSGTWIDELMITSKDLARTVQTTLQPALNQRAGQRRD